MSAAHLVAEQVIRETRVGPIPDAEELLRYEQACPGLADRIMQQFERQTTIAEKQAEHRMGIEKQVVTANIEREQWGQIIAGILAAGVLGGCFYLLVLGHTLTGLSSLIAAITALVIALQQRRRAQEQEIEGKKARQRQDSGEHRPVGSAGVRRRDP
jgi:uncharacterized membrane protein